MAATGRLLDGSEHALRAALRKAVPELGDLPVRVAPYVAPSDPRWWSNHAVVGDRFVVKFAWSPGRAELLWREGVILDRLRRAGLRVPELVAAPRDPALVVTRLLPGGPLSWEWSARLGSAGIERAAGDLAQFLVCLHALDAGDILGDLPTVVPTAQADSTRLREGFRRIVDERRAASVLRWCDWVDGVLTPAHDEPVLLHGDLHGYNQLWDHQAGELVAIVDFEETGVGDRHFDFRYLPDVSEGPELALAVKAAYERLWGTSLTWERVMAWHVLTVMGDALWRTEAGVALPGGGTVPDWVDRLAGRLRPFGVGG